jgi:hypothetical protein
MSNADILRAYWRRWVRHFASVCRDTGRPGTGPPVRDPQGYWRQLREADGSMAAAQVRLVGRYGISLLGRYACHRIRAAF